MNQTISISFLLTGIVVLVLYFFVLIYSNSKLSKVERNSFLNSYPYQFYQEMSNTVRILSYVLLLSVVLLFSIGEVFLFTAGISDFISICLCVTFPLSHLLLATSNLIPLSHPRSHIYISAISFMLFDFSCITYGIDGIFGSVNTVFYNRVLQIIIGVVGLLLFLAMLNPKLLDWAKMEKTEEDGKTIYVKPKVNFYPLYEWIYLLSSGIVSLLLLLSSIFA